MFNCPPTEQNGSRSLTILIILMLALAHFCFTIYFFLALVGFRVANRITQFSVYLFLLVVGVVRMVIRSLSLPHIIFREN